MAFKKKLALLSGPLLLTGGILNYLLTPFFVKLISSKLLVIEKGSFFFDNWVKTPVPLTFNLYVFDVQNPKKIMQGAKPILKELGPFSFVQTREKKILGFSSDKETVTYLENIVYKFNPEKSISDLNRYYTTPNVAFLSTLKVWNEQVKNLPLSFIVQPVAQAFLTSIMEYYQQNLFINVTLNEIIFKGIHLPYVSLLRSLTEILKKFGSSTIGKNIKALSNSSFSFFKYINNTMNGPYEVYTGHFGISKLAQFKKYKNKEILDIWSDKECNIVKGSDGTQFSPLKNDKSDIYVFSHEFCRSLKLEYKRETMVRGITTLRYEPSPEIFMKKNSNGKCDCLNSYKCKNSGIIDVSSCWYGAPVYASLPHFSGKNFANLQKSIIGLKPDELKYRSYLDVDPISGATLRGSKKGQLNTFIEKVSSVRSIRAVKDELFVPLFWFEENGEINDYLEKEIKMKSVYPLIITNYLLIFSLVAGLIFSFISCIFCVCCGKRKNKKKIHSNPNNQTNKLYIDKNYQNLTNLEDAESTKTDSSSTSLNHTKSISILSSSSNDSSKSQPGFILVQPIQYDSLLLDNKKINQKSTHSLNQFPLMSTYKIVNDNRPDTNISKFKSQIELNNYLPSVNYRPPSPATIDESMKMISKLIESNSKNLDKNNHYLSINQQSISQENDHQLITRNSNNQLILLDSNNHLVSKGNNHKFKPEINEQDRSINELTINQRKTKLTKQFSSQDSFDYE